MEPDELYEAMLKTSGARGALAALILANDHKGARLRAQQMSQADLISLVLLFTHEYVGGTITATERVLEQGGMEPEQAHREAPEIAMLQFRVAAEMWPQRGSEE